jgi:hypothetical protein
MRFILFFLVFVTSFNLAVGQGYTYSYIDPCTKKSKAITVPPGQNKITVNYYGNIKVFEGNDFFNGNFSSWLGSVSDLNSGGPCEEVRMVLTRELNMVVAQNVVTTIMNITSVTQALSASTSFSSLGNAVNNSEDKEKDSKEEGKEKVNKDKEEDNKKESKTDQSTKDKKSDKEPESEKDKNQEDTKTNTENEKDQKDNSNTDPNKSDDNKNSNQASNQNKQNQKKVETKSENNKSGSVRGSKIKKKTNQETKEEKESDKSDSKAFGSAITNSISNAENGSEDKKDNKGGSKSKTGSIIGTGDIVLLKSAEDQSASDQYRITASFTRSNTNNTRVWGILGNFTTQVNLSNLTFYKAWVLPKSQWTVIAANSSMINSERDAFNTTTIVSSKRFKGNWKKLTAMGGLNFTTAKIGESNLNNLSAVGGGFFSYNVGKKVSGSILCLGVYSPFTHFYEGRWWESGTLLVPFNSWDYKITKTFKFNVSMSGIYELKKSVLNYQILMGGKILL